MIGRLGSRLALFAALALLGGDPAPIGRRPAPVKPQKPPEVFVNSKGRRGAKARVEAAKKRRK